MSSAELCSQPSRVFSSPNIPALFSPSAQWILSRNNVLRSCTYLCFTFATNPCFGLKTKLYFHDTAVTDGNSTGIQEHYRGRRASCDMLSDEGLYCKCLNHLAEVGRIPHGVIDHLVLSGEPFRNGDLT